MGGPGGRAGELRGDPPADAPAAHAPQRLASGFPDDVVAGKTGTLPGIRNEIGVVERADGTRVAVAVFTRSDSPVAALPQADRAIGTAARIAADALRAPP